MKKKKKHQDEICQIGYWVCHGNQTARIMFLYSNEFEAANADLNPGNDGEREFEIAKTYEEAFKIALGGKPPGAWQTETPLRRRAITDVLNALDRLAEALGGIKDENDY
ncbi:MAG: hypothetical protein JRH18_08930 [Deltaproteobacteria bacterium]|nr:hypothetical protein [Deltaproteobacteria bacterium]MBW2151777.1 hypothetical protein [Deltaproteobacteria bacterium]